MHVLRLREVVLAEVEYLLQRLLVHANHFLLVVEEAVVEDRLVLELRGGNRLILVLLGRRLWQHVVLRPLARSGSSAWVEAVLLLRHGILTLAGQLERLVGWRLLLDGCSVHFLLRLELPKLLLEPHFHLLLDGRVGLLVRGRGRRRILLFLFLPHHELCTCLELLPVDLLAAFLLRVLVNLALFDQLPLLFLLKDFSLLLELSLKPFILDLLLGLLFLLLFLLLLHLKAQLLLVGRLLDLLGLSRLLLLGRDICAVPRCNSGLRRVLCGRRALLRECVLHRGAWQLLLEGILGVHLLLDFDAIDEFLLLHLSIELVLVFFALLPLEIGGGGLGEPWVVLLSGAGWSCGVLVGDSLTWDWLWRQAWALLLLMLLLLVRMSRGLFPGKLLFHQAAHLLPLLL